MVFLSERNRRGAHKGRPLSLIILHTADATPALAVIFGQLAPSVPALLCLAER